MSLRKKTFSALIFQFSSLAIRGILQLFVLMIFSRHLTAYEFGVIAIVNIVVNFTFLFAELGVGSALIQKEKVTKKTIRTAFTFSLSFGIIFIGVFYWSSNFLAIFFEIPELKKVIQVMSISFFIIGLGMVSKSLLEKELQFKKLFLANTISYAIGHVIIGIYLVLNGFGVWSIVYATLIQNSIMTLITYSYKPHNVMPYFSKRESVSLLNFGAWITFGRVTNFLAQQVDKLVTGKILGSQSLGKYERAIQITQLPNVYVGQSLDTVLFPAMAQRQDNKPLLKKVHFQSLSLVNLIMLPLSSILVILSPEIVVILLGDKWLNIVVPLKILLLSISIRTLVRMCDSLLRATGNVRSSFNVKLLFLISMIVLCTIGAKWGLIGVALGSLVSFSINLLFMFRISKKILEFRYFELVKVLYPGLLIGIIVYLIMKFNLLLISHFIFNHLLIAILSSIGTLFIMAVMTFKFTNILGEYGQEYVQKLKMKIKKV